MVKKNVMNIKGTRELRKQRIKNNETKRRRKFLLIPLVLYLVTDLEKDYTLFFFLL
jgi:hypothetical protein